MRIFYSIYIFLKEIKKPFDGEKYIIKNGYFGKPNRKYNNSKNKENRDGGNGSNCVGQQQEKVSEMDAISGWWLVAPRLHYYIFNYKKEKTNKQHAHILTIKNKHAAQKREAGAGADSALGLKISSNGDYKYMLVLHELSRSGAPILGIELAKQIRKTESVLVVALKAGPLEDYLDEIKMPYVVIDNTQSDFEYRFKNLLNQNNISLAIVNSLCSYQAIPIIHENNNPIVTLVHEFYSYANCSEVFKLIHDKSHAVIYPSSLVLNDVVDNDKTLEGDHIFISPQGLIPSPTNTTSLENDEKEIADAYRDGIDPKSCVIVGMGSIEPRKGVDLFILTAQLILKKYPSANFRFIWIGDLLPHYPSDYLIFLKEHIKKSNLEKYVKIINHIKNLAIAYQNADIFYLSSRLDPLPLVSIEAMMHELPLVCFKGASGTADYLNTSDEVSSTIVPYLDIDKAAEKIYELIINQNERKRIGVIQKKFATEVFDMKKYTSEILKKFEHV